MIRPEEIQFYLQNIPKEYVRVIDETVEALRRDTNNLRVTPEFINDFRSKWIRETYNEIFSINNDESNGEDNEEKVENVNEVEEKEGIIFNTVEVKEEEDDFEAVDDSDDSDDNKNKKNDKVDSEDDHDDEKKGESQDDEKEEEDEIDDDDEDLLQLLKIPDPEATLFCKISRYNPVSRKDGGKENMAEFHIEQCHFQLEEVSDNKPSIYLFKGGKVRVNLKSKVKQRNR